MPNHTSRPMIDSLETRRLFATSSPLAINFNDEALWDGNFQTAVAQAQALGVKAVRLWFGFDSYDSRPNTWDPVSPYGAVSAGEIAPEDAWLDAMPTVMKRAFDLKRLGFTVLGVLQSDYAAAPESAEQARAFVRHMMDNTETPDSTLKLKDVIDYWEIGNETDSGSYWSPSATNKTLGLKSYVDSWLIPAATELNANGDNEPVVTAGVSYSPTDLKTIIDQITVQKAWGVVDYLGFHPYGVVNSTTNDIAKNTATAAGYAKAVGRTLMATEWNIRGFGNAGTNDALWATTMDKVYRETILPNYDVSFYFALVNNWAARGGTTSARPGGLLKHTSPVIVTPTSPVADLRTYFNSPMVAADPFYSVYKGWTVGSISGVVTTQNAGQSVAGISVFVDTNGNTQFDPGEPTTATAANGAYTLNYFAGDVPAGTYGVRIVSPANVSTVVGNVSANLQGGTTVTDVNFVIKAAVPAATGSISGILWNDGNANGVFDGTDSYTGARTVFLDANRNGKLDAGEKSVSSDANSNYTFAGLAAGTYYVSRVFPAGYRLSNNLLGYVAITVADGQTITGVNIGTTDKPVGWNADPMTASVTGRLWDDTNADGIWGSTEFASANRTVFVDANRNGKLDAGEKSTVSDANGNYNFPGLAAGTYYVSVVLPTGYRLSNSTVGYQTITVAAGQVAANTVFAITDKPVGWTGNTTGSFSGYLWNDGNANGVFDNLDTYTGARTVYLDANRNGKLDAGEKSISSDATGNYTFSGLAAGTYYVTRVFPSGYKLSNGTGGAAYVAVTLTAGGSLTGVNLGSRYV